MKKNTFTPGSWAMLFFIMILIAGCTGEDGAPGPDGADGADGANGKNGTDGKDGDGFDEAIAKGSIILVLDGVRPDDKAFKDTIYYRYAPTHLYYSSFTNDTNVEAGEISATSTHLERYQSLDGTGSAYANSRGFWYNAAGPKLVNFNFGTENTIVAFPAEHKFFSLYASISIDQYYNSDTQQVDTETNLDNLVITSYTYDAATTGKVAYRYSGTMPVGNNSTGHDLKVTVIVDASVYGGIQGESSGGDRHQGGSGRTAVQKVAKAEMQSMK